MTLLYRMVIVLVVSLMIIAGCSSSRSLTVNKLKKDNVVKFYLRDGSIHNGIVLNKDVNEIYYVSSLTHTLQTIQVDKIRRMEKLTDVLDYHGYQISQAEIDKNKKNKNTWGYAIGGAFIGAAVGIAVSLPLWYSEVDQVPPYLFAGAGAVAGSIYFAFKGQNKDRDNAISEIRYNRLSEQGVENEIDVEKQKIKNIEEEKQKILDQLKDKNN